MDCTLCHDEATLGPLCAKCGDEENERAAALDRIERRVGDPLAPIAHAISEWRDLPEAWHRELVITAFARSASDDMKARAWDALFCRGGKEPSREMAAKVIEDLVVEGEMKGERHAAE